MSWTAACTLSELAEESALHVELDDEPVCVARSEGKVYAFSTSARTPRSRCREGDVEDGTVECWLHGSRFDLATGKPTGPAGHPAGARLCSQGRGRRRPRRSGVRLS